MIEIDGIGSFEDQVAALENAMTNVRDVTSGLNRELDKTNSVLADTSSGVKSLSSGLSRNLSRAFESVVFDGEKLSDALGRVGRSMMNSAFSSAVRPISNEFGKAVSGGIQNLISSALPFADGGVFGGGRVLRFADGGLVGGPTLFPMRGGVGMMGEAGAEAILPLGRASDGKLGVRADGAQRPLNVTFNITTPDVAGFQRSQSQIAAQMSRALGHGERNR
jgi:phage-related minor tail protein